MSRERIVPILNKDLTMFQKLNITEKRMDEMRAIVQKMLWESEDAGDVILAIASREDFTAVEKTYAGYAFGVQLKGMIEGEKFRTKAMLNPHAKAGLS